MCFDLTEKQCAIIVFHTSNSVEITTSTLLRQLQLALQKRNISYKFEFLRRQYHAESLNFLIGTLFAWNCFRYRARNMVKSPKGECNDGQYCDGCYELISLILATLKRPIRYKYPTRSIRPVRSSRYHHAIYSNRETQARRVVMMRHAFKQLINSNNTYILQF